MDTLRASISLSLRAPAARCRRDCLASSALWASRAALQLSPSSRLFLGGTQSAQAHLRYTISEPYRVGGSFLCRAQEASYASSSVVSDATSSAQHCDSPLIAAPAPLSQSLPQLWADTGPSLGRSLLQRRKFRPCAPLLMGRRAAKIATRKNAQDARRSKLYGRLGKLIVSAVKQGGPSAASNPALAAALAFAKQIGAPKELIDRNVKKAGEKGQADYAETVYEVYGLGGVGIVVEALTDNNARTAAGVREWVKKGGGKMADPGSVLFNFRRCGVIAVPAQSTDADELLLSAVDAGAEDVVEPEAEAEEGEEDSKSLFKVITAPDEYAAVRAKLEEMEFQIDADSSGPELLPLAFVEPDDDARSMNDAMLEKLLELDDVDAVYYNQK